MFVTSILYDNYVICHYFLTIAFIIISQQTAFFLLLPNTSVCYDFQTTVYVIAVLYDNCIHYYSGLWQLRLLLLCPTEGASVSKSPNLVKYTVVFTCVRQRKLVYNRSLPAQLCFESCKNVSLLYPSHLLSAQATADSVCWQLWAQGWTWMKYTKKIHRQPNPWSTDSGQYM